MVRLSSSGYRSRQRDDAPPVAFLNTRWGRDEAAGRHYGGGSRYGSRTSSYSSTPRTGYYSATSTTPAYLAELRSPTKKTVSRTTPPRSFSPRGGPKRTLRHKPAFESKPSTFKSRDNDSISGLGLDDITTSALERRSYRPQTHSIPITTSVAGTRRDGEDRTTYDIDPSSPAPQVHAKSQFSSWSSYNPTSPRTRLYSTSSTSPYRRTTSPQTRLYTTSSTATASPKFSPVTSHHTPRSTPGTSPSVGMTPNPTTPPIHRTGRSTYITEPERKRRHQGYFGNTPSPPGSPSRPSRQSGTKSRSPRRRKSPSLRRTDSTNNLTFLKDRSSTPRSSSPLKRTKTSTIHDDNPTTSSHYRYPSLSKGTAATPQRRINAGMVPIDTSLSSRKAAPAKPTFLQEDPLPHSRYPSKQREGVVVSGERERAFKGWLGRNKDKDGDYGTARKLDAGSRFESRDLGRRSRRRGKGVWFWEWSPR